MGGAMRKGISVAMMICRWGLGLVEVRGFKVRAVGFGVACRQNELHRVPVAAWGKYISMQMLPLTKYGNGGPLVVALHWLSGSAKTWAEVGGGFAERGTVLAAIDLPGFGRATEWEDTSIAASVEAVMATVQTLRREHAGPWVLLGHSMGGKIAAIVARAAVDGREGLEELRGVVLVSPSPPGVEPMEESTRRKMMESLGESTRDAEEDRAHAQKFVDDNTGKLALVEIVRERSVEDVLRMSRAAFRAWLTTGSREDWAARAGVLPLPALVLAGSEEPALGPKVQQKATATHFVQAEVVTLEGGGHLGPLERPVEVVERAMHFMRGLGLAMEPVQQELSAGFRRLIESERTSPLTRAVMLSRMAVEADARDVFSADEWRTMRAMLRCVLPGCGFDLSPRVSEWMSAKTHDGWRHDSLPTDAEAWRRGLRSMDAASMHEYSVPFVAVDAARQDAMLAKAQKGALGGGLLARVGLGEAFTAEEMKLWFGDFCAEATKLYVSDPRTMERMGFTGFADEGGFTQIRMGGKESFEI
jgi:pimeloyl-ACP methyl ester carboxylesterase